MEFSDVKYIKRRKSILELTASQDGNPLYAFPYVLDAYIPPALDLEFDQHFTIINSSRSSINIISSDGKNLNGSSSTLAVGAGSGKKIKYTKSSNTFSDVSSELEVSTVGNSISNVSAGIFTASVANSASSPLLLNVSLEKIKIINNTGSILYLKNSNLSANIAGSATYQVAKSSYVDLIVKGDNFLVSNLNEDISLTTLSSGVLISSAIYKDKAVVFDADVIDKISFDSENFFSTTIIPFIKVIDFKDVEPFDFNTHDYEHRTEDYEVKYTIKNKSGSVHRKQSFVPMIVDSNGFSDINKPICHLNEFLIDSSVNNKILLTNNVHCFLL